MFQMIVSFESSPNALYAVKGSLSRSPALGSGVLSEDGKPDLPFEGRSVAKAYAYAKSKGAYIYDAVQYRGEYTITLVDREMGLLLESEEQRYLDLGDEDLGWFEDAVTGSALKGF